MCQVIPPRRGTVDFELLFGAQNRVPAACYYQASPKSPNLTSTMVLLTVAGPKPNLPLEQRSYPFSMGEGLSKVWGGLLCIDTKQALSVSYLTLSL